MNENLKEFLLKTGYAVAGLIVSSLVPFLNANPATLGSATAIIVGILSVVEQEFFPSTPITSNQA
jgi:hypothetical protein